MITLKRITKENWKKACLIELKPEQQHFLAPVAYCLARAYVAPYKEPIEPFVIMDDNDVVGFFWLTFTDNRTNCVLCGFRIDFKFQGLGYSKLALNQIRKLLEIDYRDCATIQLFVEDNNIPAKNLYTGFGFDIVNNYDYGLIHMVYTLKNNIKLKLISVNCLDDE